MSTDNIPIIPFAVDMEIDYVKIYVENFQLNAIDCWVSVYEYDKNDKFINVSRLYVPPEVYSEWSTSDDYIIDYALDQLAFQKRPDTMIHFSQ